MGDFIGFCGDFMGIKWDLVEYELNEILMEYEVADEWNVNGIWIEYEWDIDEMEYCSIDGI